VKQKITLEDLMPSRPLPCDLFSQAGIRVAQAGTPVPDEAAMARLIRQGLFADAASIWRQPPETAAQMTLHAAEQLHTMLMLRDRPAEFARAFVPAMAAIADLINASWQRDPHVLLAVLMLQTEIDPAVRHALLTAAIVQCVLGAMQRDAADDVLILSVAAGMRAAIPTRAEGQVVALLRSQGGPGSSAEYLSALGVTRASWIELHTQAIALLHSATRPPQRKNTGAGPSLQAQLVAMSDLYCSHLAVEADQAESSRVILRDLLIEHGGLFDARLASYFIRALGVYIIGSVVLLRSGEIGVVCEQSDEIDAPWVCSTAGSLGVALEPTLRDTRDERHAIQSALGPTDLVSHIDMQRVWGPEARGYALPYPVAA